MSIIAAAEPAPATAAAFFVILALAIGIALARWAGVLAPRSVVGPARWNLGEGLGGRFGALFIVLGVGLAVWYLGQVMLITAWVVGSGDATTATTQPLDRLTAANWATLATAPGLLALGVLLIGDRMLGRGVIGRLGYGLRDLWLAPWPAIVGTVVLVPFLYAVMLLAQLIYQAVGYEHPEAHDLLLQMRDADSGWVRWGLLAGAVVVAPLFEELLFRGHLQTLLAAMFDRFADRSKPTPPEVEAGTASGFPVVGGSQEAIPYARRDQTAWPRWAAIISTALLFSAVHAAWTAPPIFVLAVAMGYAYERTGNLWVSILMHALFNGLSTVIYLNVTA